MDTNNGHIEFEGKANDLDQAIDSNKPVFNLSSDSMSKLFDKK